MIGKVISIVLILFVIKDFYKVAKLYDKNPFQYSFLGVLSYFIGLVIGYLILAIFIKFLISTSNEHLITYANIVIPIPTGILICTFYQKYLQKEWENKDKNPTILDEEL